MYEMRMPQLMALSKRAHTDEAYCQQLRKLKQAGLQPAAILSLPDQVL